MAHSDVPAPPAPPAAGAAPENELLLLSSLGAPHEEPVWPALAPPLPSRQRRGRLQAAAEFGLAAVGCYAFDYALHNPYCALLFRCGCTYEWAGGWTACNVHHPAVTELGENPARCPWCAVMEGDLRPLALLISQQATVLVMLAAYTASWTGHLRLRGGGGGAARRVGSGAGHRRLLPCVTSRMAAAVAGFYGWGFVWCGAAAAPTAH
jgi:hypothetical protein